MQNKDEEFIRMAFELARQAAVHGNQPFGALVVKDGEVVATPMGATHWVDARVPERLEKELMKYVEAEFKKYYTVSLRNYPVEDAYLPVQRVHRAVGGAA